MLRQLIGKHVLLILLRSNFTSDPSLKVKLGSAIIKREGLTVYFIRCNYLCFKSIGTYLCVCILMPYKFLNLENVSDDSTIILSIQHSLISLYSIISPYLLIYLPLGTLCFCIQKPFSSFSACLYHIKILRLVQL